jgi:TonB-dependent receptor
MKMHLLASASLASLATMAAVMPAHAQVVASTTVSAAVAGEVVHGRVTNGSGVALPGAEVLVRATGHRAVTNTQGEFDLVLPTGQAVLEVRYLGLPTANQTVSVAPGGADVSIVLGAGEVGTVEDVIVTGVITDGVARSLNQQKNADGTVNVLSADAIGRYPDPNVAESLQRVQGIAIQRDQGEGRYINVRGAPSAFTAVSVDGVQVPAVDPGTRAVDLDTLPSDIVSNIEVSKTLLPSQEADSIAGAVNIKTRSPFDRRRLAVSGYAGGSYNDYGGEDVRGGATVSNVFADDRFGALLSVSYSETNRRPDNVENAWVFDEEQNVFVIEETLFKDYETKRTRQAVTGALEWRPTDDVRAYLRGSFAQFEDDEYRNTLGLVYADGDLRAGATNTTATYDNARITRQVRHRTQKNDITTLVAGGEKTFSNGAIWDASLSWANSEQSYPNRNELLYRSTATTLSYDATNHYMPTYSVFSEATGFYRNPANFSFRENTFRENTTQQEDVAFKTNFELPSQFAGREVTWKFGAKFNTREITADEERFRARPGDTPNPGTLASFLSDRPSRNYDYDLGFKYDAGKADAYFDSVRGTSPRRMPDSVTADYTAQEDILAGYAQARFDLGATNVIVGLRVENTKFDGSATVYTDRLPAADRYSQADVSRDDTEFFPNLTLRHTFSDNLIGRFALTRSISRPEFNQIVPREMQEADGTDTSYTVGNPDLQPTLANNIDAGLEYYFASLGVVSANAFYKDLTDYRYILKYDETRTENLAEITDSFEKPINAPEGHIAGLELNLQRKFDFLPGALSGFGVFANYTWTDAEIKTAQSYGGRDTFALPGQSDTNYNAALFYEMAGFSARLSYTKRGDYLEEIDADDANLDLYVEGREQLDFTASYDFGNGVEVFGEAKNLTDSAGVRYYGSRERTYEYEKFGYNVFLGLRFKL